MSVDPKEVEKLKQSNLARLQALANNNLSLSVGDLAFIKMEALIELTVTDPEVRLQFELLVELKKKEVIDQVFAEIRKAQLLQPASKLTVPGR